MIKVITHSGSFHSDELFAIGLIKLYIDDEIEITRTRDREILKEATKNPDIWVIDVGGIYNPELKNFDHHQSSFGLAWPDQTPKSSIGIVWDYLIKNKHLVIDDTAKSTVEFNLIKKIDSHDNGQKPWALSCIFGLYNRIDNNDEQFHKALFVALGMIDNSIVFASSKSAEDKKFNHLLENYDGQSIFILDTFLMGAGKRIAESTSAQAYVMPHNNDKDSNWVAHSVSEPGSIFESRALAPRNLRGLSDDELQSVSGIHDAVFVHKKGFISVASSKGSAIKLANLMF